MMSRDLSWQRLAACQYTDPEVFFSSKHTVRRVAFSICGRCEVRGECLEAALNQPAYDQHGIAGGLGVQPRLAIMRRRCSKATKERNARRPVMSKVEAHA